MTRCGCGNPSCGCWAGPVIVRSGLSICSPCIWSTTGGMQTFEKRRGIIPPAFSCGGASLRRTTFPALRATWNRSKLGPRIKTASASGRVLGGFYVDCVKRLTRTLVPQTLAPCGFEYAVPPEKSFSQGRFHWKGCPHIGPPPV